MEAALDGGGGSRAWMAGGMNEGGEGRVSLRGWMERLAQWKGGGRMEGLDKGLDDDWRVAGRLTGGVWMEGSGWMEGGWMEGWME